jgi:hypothetical protein
MIDINYSTTPKSINLVQPAERPELVYSPDPLAQVEQAELLARYYSLLAEAFRIEAAIEGEA